MPTRNAHGANMLDYGANTMSTRNALLDHGANTKQQGSTQM